MADICTVVSTYVTLAMCIPAMVCAPERDGKVLCGPPSILSDRVALTEFLNMPNRTIDSCNRTITNYRCTRSDGTMYDYSE